LSIGARFVSFSAAEEAVKLWLETAFTHEARQERRINKINDLSI
jgi:ribose 5-phosphate isomerase RpiB